MASTSPTTAPLPSPNTSSTTATAASTATTTAPTAPTASASDVLPPSDVATADSKTPHGSKRSSSRKSPGSRIKAHRVLDSEPSAAPRSQQSSGGQQHLVRLTQVESGVSSVAAGASPGTGLSSVREVTVSAPEQVLDSLAAYGPASAWFRPAKRLPNDEQWKSIEDVLDNIQIACTVTHSSAYAFCIATFESLEELTRLRPLPRAVAPNWRNKIQYAFLSAYRRLHGISLIANLAAIFAMIVYTVRGHGSFTYLQAADAVAANLFVNALVRHEHFINLCFKLCVALPQWAPLAVRRQAAKVYSYGGLHSGSGVSAFLWYIFYLVLLVRQRPLKSGPVSQALASLAGILLFDLAVIIIMAYPTIRSAFHNQWEMAHRFGAWFALGLVWTQILLIAVSSAQNRGRNAGLILIMTPAFWFLTGITCLLIYPWLRLRRREIVAEPLSNHAVRLWFPHHRTRLDTCLGIKLSTSPLFENHGFATIPEPDGKEGYSVIVSKAGDWTKALIEKPPSHLWIRGAPTLGVSRVGLLFRPCVLIATGSGIGPTLSFLHCHPSWPCRILWSAKMPEETYGPSIMASVLRADRNALIIDTKKTGKPDIVGITYALYQQCGAEAIVIISNPAATREVVYEMEARNIPAYGAIWDS